MCLTVSVFTHECMCVCVREREHSVFTNFSIKVIYALRTGGRKPRNPHSVRTRTHGRDDMCLINHVSGFNRYVANSLVLPDCTLVGRYTPPDPTGGGGKVEVGRH
jgi:hypothetical protein